MKRGLKPGNTNNKNGRPKGTINKINKELREKINDFLDGNFEKVKADFLKLEPKDRLKFYTELLPYSIPKLQAGTLDIALDFDSMTEQDLDKIIEKLKQNE